MRPIDAVARFRAMLEADGVRVQLDDNELTGSADDWRKAWNAFCRLAREPADEPFDARGGRLHVDDDVDNDLLLHESSAHGAERDRFVLWVTRQFSFYDEEDEYAGMNALTVSFECDRLPEGRVPTALRWGYAGRRREVSDEHHPEGGNWAGYVDSWAPAVEASRSFRALEALGPVRWTVS